MSPPPPAAAAPITTAPAMAQTHHLLDRGSGQVSIGDQTERLGPQGGGRDDEKGIKGDEAEEPCSVFEEPGPRMAGIAIPMRVHIKTRMKGFLGNENYQGLKGKSIKKCWRGIGGTDTYSLSIADRADYKPLTMCGAMCSILLNLNLR